MDVTEFAFFALLFIVIVAFVGGLTFRKKHGHRMKRRRADHVKHYHEMR